MLKNKKLLVYVGANQGFGLTGLLYREKFDTVIAFEPDPEMYSLLQQNINQGLLSRIPGVEYYTINAACSSENNSKSLYIFENRVSTSLGNANYEKDKSLVKQTIEVRTINLLDFLELNGINYVDCLLTDCQGSDLEIIKTLEPFIKEKKIGSIFHETHRDDFTPYTGLTNHFSEFKKILSDRYSIDYFSCDGLIKDRSDIPTDLEWDTYWVKK